MTSCVGNNAKKRKTKKRLCALVRQAPCSPIAIMTRDFPTFLNMAAPIHLPNKSQRNFTRLLNWDRCQLCVTPVLNAMLKGQGRYVKQAKHVRGSLYRKGVDNWAVGRRKSCFVFLYTTIIINHTVQVT